MDTQFDRVRRELLKDLRNAHGALRVRPESTHLSAYNYAGRFPTPEERIEVMSVLHWLVTCGVIVPGHRTNGFGFQTSNGPFQFFPYFSVTEYGFRVLDPKNEGIDPHERSKYVQEIIRRMPDADDVMRAYVDEATATFESQHYLASMVLLGVAAETLIERLYSSFAKHLNTNAKVTFEASLKSKRWASTRFLVFKSSFGAHKKELSKDLADRIDTYLDVLVTLLKTSRDDVGHGRPTRVDRDIAFGNLVYFPSLVGLVAEVESALGVTCTVP